MSSLGDLEHPTELMALSEDFFRRDALTVARSLLGTQMLVDTGSQRLRVAVVETEAYDQSERGCHCFGGRKTQRTSPMFRAGPRTYVYFIYGMHWALNVVTGPADHGQAVLIRAILPLDPDTFSLIHERRGFTRRKRPPSARFLADPWRWCDGPAKLCQALGIDGQSNDLPLGPTGPIWFASGLSIADTEVIVGPRVGIDYAGEDALLPWRFRVRRPSEINR